MTRLTKPVSREVPSTVGGEPFIVTLAPEGIRLRVKRTRNELLLPYPVAWVRAAMLAADQRLAKRRRTSPRHVRRGLLAAEGRR